jgi:dipeptidyl aminopeptidase/acylaminoacyl peptidase
MKLPAILFRVWLIAGTLLIYGPGISQDNLQYQTPPQAIVDLVDAPLTPLVSVDPKGTHMLLLERSDKPGIAELAEPELRLAGIRINPQNNGSSRAPYYLNITLKNIRSGAEKPVAGLPENVRIADLSWSPDGAHLAFTLLEQDGIQLWVAEARSGQARKLTEAVLNDAYPGYAYTWMPDSQTLLCKFVPENRPALPADADPVPTGPVVQENIGRRAPSRTYQDLLQNPRDEKLFEYYLTAQLVKVSLNGTQHKIGEPGIIDDFSASPDGKYLLVERVKRPYSYLVPVNRFPHEVWVWDASGNPVKQLADLPLAENVPIAFDAVPTGPRSFGWRSDAPATVYYAEAQDEGDPDKAAEVRDKVFVWPAPFTQSPQELVALPNRYRGIVWGNNQTAIAVDGWWKNRKQRMVRINPGAPAPSAEVVFEYSTEDRYNNPGTPVTQRNASGNSVLVLADQGNAILLEGEGASPEGNRPFLRKLDLRTKKTQEIWRSQAPYYEMMVRLLDPQKFTMITRRESVDSPPNYFLRTPAPRSAKALTSFPHPYPALQNVRKETIQYTRADGVNLTGTLYLPAGYTQEQGPLPVLMWAYPREFKSADAAGQVRNSPYEFIRLSWGGPLFWLTQGYAVLDDPALPIIGEGEQQPNDTYVEQLVAGAKAAVDEVVRRGIGDPQRIGIGGHSYGAFMTANLLAHSDLFAAGIARSGAYNRTLTPFGFQAEERTIWEAPEVYMQMSPFMHAHKVNEPILLIHGQADNNSGTFPLQSERFYNALKGHGATTRLVMLPHESHGYAARESILHTLWEMNQWLERYVKNRPEGEKTSPAGAAGK